MLTRSKPINYLDDPPWKVLCSVVVPLLFVNLIQIFVSAFSSKISSIYVGLEIFSITGYLSTALSIVSTVSGAVVSAAWIIVSPQFATRNRTVMGQYFAYAVCAIGLVILSATGILLLFSSKILSALRIPEELYSQAKLYYILYSFSYLPGALSSFFLTVLNSASSSKRILAINLFSIINGFLLSVLILVVCRAGILGSSLLPIINPIIQLLLYFTLLRKENLFSFSIFLQNIHAPDWRVIGKIINYGSVIALQSLLCSFGYLCASIQANRYLSTEYISVLSISLPLANALSTLSTAITIFTPQNYAARNKKRLQQFFRLSVTVGILYGIFCFAMYALLSKWYFSQLFDDIEIISFGAEFWLWQGISYPFLSLMFTVRYFLDSVGQSKYSLLSGIGELTGNLLCAFWLIPVFGNIGRSLSNPLGWLLGSIMLVISYCIVRKRIYE